MIKKYILGLILFFIISVGYAQNNAIADETLTTQAKEQANLMGQAFIKGDYQTFNRYTYPALVKAMGGTNKIAATLTQTVNDMHAQGMEFVSIAVDNPSKIVKNNGELQCTLQQHTTLKLPKGKGIATSTLIAVSEDGGKHWYFIDTSNKDEATIRKTLPNLSSAIVIPPPHKPEYFN